MPPILRRYRGQVVYETKRTGREWLMKVIFGRDNDTFRMVFSGIHVTCQCSFLLLQYIKDTSFKSFVIGESFLFHFKEEDGYIELCFNNDINIKGWSIRPHKVPVIVSNITHRWYYHMQ